MKFQEAQYIINYFPRLMNKTELKARWHDFYMLKLRTPDTYENPKSYYRRKNRFEANNLISNDPDVLKLLENGYEAFAIETAQRIQRDTPNQFKVNRCPNCNVIARTPYAKQCSICKHDWHNEIAAAFLFESAFRITRRPYLWIVGECSKGHIDIGCKIDLTFFQLNIVKEIKQIELCLKSINGEKKELPSLGIAVNDKEEKLIKEYLKPSAKAIMILK